MNRPLRYVVVFATVTLSAGCAPDAARDDVAARSPADALALGPAPRPTVFAPGTISTAAHDDLHAAFTPDGAEFYFVRRAPDGRFTINVSRRRTDGAGWSEPEVVPFSGEFNDQEPFVSADGERFYFTSDRPLSGTEPVRGRNAWVARATAAGWGSPRPLEGRRLTVEPPPDREGLSRFWGQPREPKEGPEGALYFWAERPGTLGHTDVYRAAPADGGFAEPENLGPPINSELYETGMVVAPDGRYMIFGRDAGDAGFGRGDLYVSFRERDGWTEPRNLGALVNSDQFDYSPRLSSDGRYLFFSSNRNRGGDGAATHDIYYIELAALGL